MRPVRPWTLLSLLLLAGCAQILDLEKADEDSTVDLDAGMQGGDGGGGVVTPVGCDQYCATAKSVCSEGFRVFETDANCSAVCKRYEPGSASSPQGNTLACRAALLASAARIGEGTGICQAAGPGGGAATAGTGQSCGSNCEGYCSLRARVCQADRSECMRQCAALPDKGSYDAPMDFRSGEDTLQCRMAHLTVASTYQEEGNEAERRRHCEHSDIRSRNRVNDVLSDGTCDAKEPSKLDCDGHCKMVMTACSQSLVYESTEQCVAFCKKLTPGTTSPEDSTAAKTLRCRREGAYDALRLGESPTACMNAGPAPDRCGAGKCSSYCALAKDACPTQFASVFATDQACLTECSGLQGASLNAPYNVTAEQAKLGHTLQCRVLRLTRALASAGTPSDALCSEMLGRGACQ